jgi:hypothetical protein
MGLTLYRIELKARSYTYKSIKTRIHFPMTFRHNIKGVVQIRIKQLLNHMEIPTNCRDKCRRGKDFFDYSLGVLGSAASSPHCCCPDAKKVPNGAFTLPFAQSEEPSLVKEPVAEPTWLLAWVQVMVDA